MRVLCPDGDLGGVHIFVPLPGSPIWNDPARFDFAFNRETTFKHYQTIGKPGEWAAHHIHKNPDQILEWATYLREVAGSRNVANFDARWVEKSQAGKALYEGVGQGGNSTWLALLFAGVRPSAHSVAPLAF
jgi:hypothetical protein